MNSEVKWVIPKYKGIAFSNFLISTEGVLVTKNKKGRNKDIKPLFGNWRPVSKVPQNRGYIEYYPTADDGQRYYLLAHRLVWSSFICDIPDDVVIDHIDADKHNNKLENLQMITRKQNTIKYHKIDKKAK